MSWNEFRSDDVVANLIVRSCDSQNSAKVLVGVVILSKPVSHMNKLGKFLNESENQLNVIYEWELSEKL